VLSEHAFLEHSVSGHNGEPEAVPALFGGLVDTEPVDCEPEGPVLRVLWAPRGRNPCLLCSVLTYFLVASSEWHRRRTLVHTTLPW